MSDTLHIKRFKEYADYLGYSHDIDNRPIEEMLDSVAYHLEQEHERNNQLEKRLTQLHEMYAWHLHRFHGKEIDEAFQSIKTDLPLPKGEVRFPDTEQEKDGHE